MTNLKTPVVRRTPANTPHGCRREIIVTLYPSFHGNGGTNGGTIGLREAGRRKPSELCEDLGALYTELLRRRARKLAFEKKAKRRR